MENISINVPSVSCSTCSGKIKDELSSLKGVANVNVDMKKQVVNVEYESCSVTPDAISQKISSLGYEIIN